MKIVAINTVVSADNAPGRIMTQICRAAKHRGDDVFPVYGRGESPKDDLSYYRVGNKADMLFHAVMSRMTDSAGLYSTYATQRLIKRLKRFAPDVVHLHNLHGYYINYPLLMQWLSRENIPVVLTMHDCWTYTGHCCYYSANKCYKWQNSCADCEFYKTYPQSILSQAQRNFKVKIKAFTSVKNLAIVPVSQWLAAEVKQSFWGDISMRIIPNGIDQNIFRPSAVKGNDEIKILGVASNWKGQKNFDFFLRLAESLPNAKILIAGDLARSQKNKCPENLITIGRITELTELAKLYSSVDIFINPSREETFGMTTIEAMSCGTPVIVNDATALPEVVSPEAGIVVNIDDMGEVLHSIKKIMNDYRNYSMNSRKQAVTHYTIDQMTESYLKLYDYVVKK